MRTKKQQAQHVAQRKYIEKNREEINRKRRIWDKKRRQDNPEVKKKINYLARKRMKKWLKSDDNKKSYLNSRIKYRYGVTLEFINEYKDKTGNKCEICREIRITKKIPKGLVIDHNHKTGKFRGILCDKCNRGIGYFLENTNSLKNAIKYLKDRNETS